MRRGNFKQVRQRKQHEPKADSYAPEIARPCRAAAAEDDDPDQNEQRREAGNLEREHLDDKGRADIGAEHDSERRHELERAACAKGGNDEACGGATLQNCGRAKTGGKGAQPVIQRLRQKPSQVGAESAQDAALDHVHAPEQERDGSREVDQCKGGFDKHTSRRLSACLSHRQAS